MLLCSLTHDLQSHSRHKLAVQVAISEKNKETSLLLAANIAALQPIHLLDIASVTSSRSLFIAAITASRLLAVAAAPNRFADTFSLTGADCRCRERDRETIPGEKEATPGETVGV